MKSVRCLFAHCQSLPNFCHHQIVVSITVCSPERPDIKYTWMPFPTYKNMVNLIVFPSGDIQVNLWMLRCGNIVLLTIRFLDVAKFTTLHSITLLISCKLSFPSGGLKMSSLPTLALKSPNKIFTWYLRNLSKHVLVPRRSCLYHHFGHEHSWKQNTLLNAKLNDKQFKKRRHGRQIQAARTSCLRGAWETSETKLFLCLIKIPSRKKNGGVEIQLHGFLVWYQIQMGSRFHIPAVLYPKFLVSTG
jgi:hypothetical protein